MTPKEKAKELLEKMYYANQPYTYEIKPAKQCALICVDEILDNIDDKHNGYYTMPDDVKSDFDYWHEVKQEIEKL